MKLRVIQYNESLHDGVGWKQSGHRYIIQQERRWWFGWVTVTRDNGQPLVLADKAVAISYAAGMLRRHVSETNAGKTRSETAVVWTNSGGGR